MKHSGEEIAVKLIDLEALEDNMVWQSDQHFYRRV